jgi:hypothetical protein
MNSDGKAADVSQVLIYSVYWRRRDGHGTRLYHGDLNHLDALDMIRRCRDEHPDATLIWALRDQDGVLGGLWRSA